MKTIRALHRCLALCFLLSLAACGGGGGSPGARGGGSISGGGGGSGSGGGGGGTTAVVTKYIGTWVRCLATGPGTSERDTLALNRSTDTTMTFSDTLVDFNNATCTGTGTGQSNTTGTVLFVGMTKTIGSDTVDEAQIQQTGSTAVLNQVLVVRGNGNLFVGLTGPGESVDSNGYPNALDPNGYTPQ